MAELIPLLGNSAVKVVKGSRAGLQSRAAGTAVLQLNCVGRVVDGAGELRVNVDGRNVVYDACYLEPLLVLEDVLQKRGLAS